MYGIGEGGSHPIFSASEMQYKPIPTYPRHTQKLPSPNENIPYSPNPSQMHFIQPDRAIALTQQAKEQALDLLIKNRLAALQRLQINLNKLLDDIINIASTFVSKHSFFGGVTRRSLFGKSLHLKTVLFTALILYQYFAKKSRHNIIIIIIL